MPTLGALVANFLRRDDGPTAVEYAVLLAVIVVVCVNAILAVGEGSLRIYSNVALNTAVSGS
jgi:pilus assembly protein Flp/PilA